MSSLHAYIDESRLRLHGDGPANLYVMVAVTVASEQVLDIQQQLRDLLPAGVKRLHWRNDRPSLRRRHLELLDRLVRANDVDGFEAHATLSRAKREEAGRTRCLTALAAHLADRGVGQLVIESRQEHQDRRDDRTLLRARADGVVPRDLQWRYGRPLGEPLLWIPDAVAGVVGHHHVDRDPEGFRDRLPEGFPATVWSGDVR